MKRLPIVLVAVGSASTERNEFAVEVDTSLSCGMVQIVFWNVCALISWLGVNHFD